MRFAPDLGRAVLQSYLAGAGASSPTMTTIICSWPFASSPSNWAWRFFTDYLAGNVYFKARRPKHNLARALVQFKLTESIEAQEAAIRAFIRDLR